MTQPEFLTVEELAELLRRTPSAIYTARSRGIEPASLGVAVGRKILWRRADIDAWFEREKQQAAVA